MTNSCYLKSGNWELLQSLARTSTFPNLPARSAGGPPRRPVIFFTANPRREALALVEPHLDADRAVGGEGLREAVIDVGAQRLQRQLAVQVPLGAGDFRAIQAARDAHLDPARAEAQRRFDRLAHRAAERHALFELHRHRLADQLRVELGLLDLLDVDEDLAVGLLLDLLFQLVDFRALAADDDARARGVDVDLELIGGPLDLDLRDPRVHEPRLQRVAQLDVFVQQLRVVLVGVPARAPGLVEAEPESCRVDFLTHYAFASSFFFARGLLAAVAFFFGAAPFRRGRGASSPVGVATTLVGFSATRTVRCAVRLTTRNARPIGAGRIRFCDGPWSAKHAATNRRSTSPLKPSLFCALAIAERSTFSMSRATLLRAKRSVASAWFTSRPRIRSMTSPAFCAEVRMYLATA